jgi:hypothetical protein
VSVSVPASVSVSASDLRSCRRRSRTFAIMSRRGHDEFCQRTAQIGGRQHTITPLTRPQAAAKANTFLAPSVAAAGPTSARPKDPSARGLGRQRATGLSAGVPRLATCSAGCWPAGDPARCSSPTGARPRARERATSASSAAGRMSYRRAAEIFAEHTRQLDPAGCGGWTLYQLRRPPRVSALENRPGSSGPG